MYIFYMESYITSITKSNWTSKQHSMKLSCVFDYLYIFKLPPDSSLPKLFAKYIFLSFAFKLQDTFCIAS